MTVAERIYIGGLDPPRLRAIDVMKRLKSLDIEVLEPIFPNIDDETRRGAVDSDSDDEDNDGVNSKCFFHLVVISKQADISALDIIAKKYHHVKWKGCKLIVQAARPNFLNRLEEERQQYQRKEEPQQHSNEGEEGSPNNNSNNESTIDLPRRLRIRKRHGEEAFHVDTKPCDVEDWSQFSRALEKIKKRREKLAPSTTTKTAIKKQTLTTPTPSGSKSTAFLNRAVHIRFGRQDYKKLSSASTTVSSNEKDDPYYKHPLESKSDVSSTSDDSSSSSVDSVSSEEAPPDMLPGEGKSPYAWSDDDDSVGSMSKDDATTSSEEEDQEQDVTVNDGDEKQTIVEEEDDEEDDENINNEASVSSEESNAGAPPAENSPAKKDYEWSSDDDDDGDDNEEEDKASDDGWASQKAKKILRPVAVNDEFTAGIEDIENEDDESISDSEERDITVDMSNHQQDKVALDQDVEVNLNILSSIFPDVAKTKPALQQHPDDDDTTGSGAANTIKEQRQISNQSGWGDNGLMLRYDPSKESAQKFVVDASADAQNGTNMTGADNDSSDDQSSRKGKGDNVENDKAKDAETSSDSESSSGSGSEKQKEPENSMATTTEAETKPSSTEERLYEQGKLEDVFRQARDAWEDPQSHPVAMSDDTAVGSSKIADTGGSFAFGFDLGKPQGKESQPMETPTQTDGFAFSFNLGGNDAPPPSTKAEAFQADAVGPAGPASMDTPFKNDERDEPTTVTKLRRRRFPDNVLDSYVSLFFNMNDGKRMAEDPEGFGRDERVKEKWNKERQALTLDWKRKRKYAMSRLEKRKKFR